MSAMRRRILITLAVLAVILGLLSRLPVTLPDSDDYRVLSVSTGLPTISIREGVEIQQDFPATGRLIDSIYVLVRGARHTSEGTVRVALSRSAEEGDKIIGEALSKVPAREEVLQRFKFRRAVKVVPGEILSLRVSARGKTEGVGWVIDPSVKEQELSLKADARPQAGAGRFAVHYRRAKGSAASVSRLLWKRVTVFSHLFAKILLAGGFLLALLSMVYALLWPPQDDTHILDEL